MATCDTATVTVPDATADVSDMTASGGERKVDWAFTISTDSSQSVEVNYEVTIDGSREIQDTVTVDGSTEEDGTFEFDGLSTETEYEICAEILDVSYA